MLLWTLWMYPWITAVRADVHVGAAYNIFTSFGDLGAVVKTEGQWFPWISDHHSTEVFKDVLETRNPFISPYEAEFNGNFLVQLCDNLAQLKAALYLDHFLEGVDRPWQAYSGGWNRSVAAAHLGINSSYLLGAHGYALVRLVKYDEQVMLSPEYDLHFNQWTEDGANKVIPDQPETVFDFIANFGSHYVSSYISGDGLYQVFVFAQNKYKGVQEAMRRYEETGQGLDQVLEYFTPLHTEHFGRIVSLSRNASMELWAEHHLQNRIMFFNYPNLLKVYSDPDLLQVLERVLGNDAILAIELQSLAPYFSDERKQMWFNEVLDNHLKLWEISV